MSLEYQIMELENFKTFRDRQVLPLKGLGLVLVKGDNRVDPSADSNGSGKTTLWDALSWVQFGETLRGERFDELACRFTDGPCEVALNILRDGDLMRVERGQRPTKRYIKQGATEWRGDAETKGVVERFLGYGFQTFKNAQVFGQETFDRFARAGQAEQMKMLDEIQGLDFRAALDRAKRWRDEWTAKLGTLQTEAQTLYARQQQAQEAVEGLRRAKVCFEDTKKDRIQAAQERVQSAADGLVWLKEDLVRVNEAAAALPGFRKRQQEAEALRNEAEAAARKLAGATAALTAAKTAMDRVNDAVAALLERKVCPTCRGKITGGRVREVQEAFQPDYDRAEKEVDRLADAAERLLKARDSLVKRLEAFPKIDPKALGLAETAALRASKLAGEIRDAEAALKLRKQELVAEEGAKWDGARALAEALEAGKRYADELGKNKQEQGRANATMAVAEYWVEAFGDRGLRSLLFDSIEGFLNERVAHHLAVLTAGTANASWSALQELKKGGFKEKMTLSVEWAYGAASYRGGSSGQDRRIDLVQFVALQDFAESRTARPFPLKVWDEPGDHLDRRGMEIFCNWIESDARTRGTGFLVTHSEYIESMIQPDEIWTCVLDADGTHVERSGARVDAAFADAVGALRGRRGRRK